MLDESTFFGFDAADDDGTLTVVAMRRTADGWRVDQVDGPDNPDLSRVVARIAGEHLPRPRPRADSAITELVEGWMAEHTGVTFELTDWQRAVLAKTFEKHMAEGTIRLYP